jgi:hypothetical protein
MCNFRFSEITIKTINKINEYFQIKRKNQIFVFQFELTTQKNLM